ncbi:hypothetical protein DFH09DRAFT_1371414 [Mycena vulgaris]|nr:hypothetical protein DFH09DRAFT_1371414 [Mycena vulgaris]
MSFEIAPREEIIDTSMAPPLPRRPRALLIVAGALTLVALAVVLGPTVGLPVPERFAEYYHGPPPPPHPPSDDDVHPPPSAPPSDDRPSLAAARARYALKTSRPPPRGFDAFYAFARAPERGCLVTACTPTLRRSGRFLDPSRKRGPPKGSIDAIEARLYQTEALVGILLAAAAGAGGTDEAHVSLARGILARIDHSAYGPAGRGASSSKNRGNNGTPGAINAGPAGMAIGSTLCVVFLLSSTSVALVPSFLPPLLLLCGGGVPRLGGRGGGVSERARWCCALARWRDRGGVLALQPAQGSAHIVVASPHSTPARPARDGRPRLRAARAAYVLSLPGSASSRAAEPVLAAPLLSAYAYPRRLFPCVLRIIALVLLLLLHPRDAFPLAFAFGLFTYFLHLHVHVPHICACSCRMHPPSPLSFRARVRVPSESTSSHARRVRREDECVLARRRVLRE